MENKKLNVIIAASGTGGHIYPGIAIAREFKERGYNPVFFVSGNAASAEIIKNSGFEYAVFKISGLPKIFSFGFIKFCVQMPLCFFKALIRISNIKPVAVIGTGGYMSVPVIFAAKILGKKTFIHEQNVIPGKANRFLNGAVDKTFISFKSSDIYFKRKNTVFFGYPVRKEIAGVSKKEACAKFNLDENIFTLLIFGGSLGAVKLNEIAFSAAELLSLKEKIQVIHITGHKGYEEIKAKAAGKDYYNVYPYMHDIFDAYAASCAVICRSGAGTLFELTALNKPAVLVPYPYAADNHQFHNAKEAEAWGNFIVIEESKLTPENLLDAVKELRKPRKDTLGGAYKFPQGAIVEEILKGIK